MVEWPITGHEWAVDFLQGAIERGHLSHAYLFTGPSQIGKTTLARVFAQTLLCEVGGSTPCGHCRACQRVMQDRFPDAQVVAADKNAILIDQVRALQSDAALSPLEGRYKVFIIREIERATLPAANALLKILEEPPRSVILLLTSARRDQVPSTILSRCQILSLRSLPLGQVQEALETRWQVEPERAELLARLSGGRLGWAVNAHTDADLWQERSRRLDDLVRLTGSDYHDRLLYTESLSKQPEVIERTLGLWATWWRDLMLIQSGLTEAIINLDRKVQLCQQAELYPPVQTERALTDIVRSLKRIHANVNARLVLDVLALHLPRPAA